MSTNASSGLLPRPIDGPRRLRRFAINERFNRRHIRISPPGQGLLIAPRRADGEQAVLPALRPRVPPPPQKVVQARGRKQASRPEIPRSIPTLLRTVIAAVNARGICAAHAARLAELPVAEVDGIESLCECVECRRMRAH